MSLCIMCSRHYTLEFLSLCFYRRDYSRAIMQDPLHTTSHVNLGLCLQVTLADAQNSPRGDEGCRAICTQSRYISDVSLQHL